MRERGISTKKLRSKQHRYQFFLIFYFYNLEKMAYYIQREKRRLHMYEHMFFFITGLVHELGPPDIGIIQFIFKLNKQQKENKMNVYKEYLSKKILETVNIEIETGADFDVTVNFCRDEYNFYLTLSREGEELEFDFIDDRLNLIIYHCCHDKLYYSITEMNEILNFKYAIDMLVELFVTNKWYTFVPDLTTHNLWKLVEQYKTGELRDYY